MRLRQRSHVEGFLHMLAVPDASHIPVIGKTGAAEWVECASYSVCAMQGASAKFQIHFMFVSGLAANSPTV